MIEIIEFASSNTFTSRLYLDLYESIIPVCCLGMEMLITPLVLLAPTDDPELGTFVGECQCVSLKLFGDLYDLILCCAARCL